MAISIPPPSSQEAVNVNDWLHGFIEVAKACLIFAGGYFTHILTSRRDRSGGIATRRRDFLVFMQGWRADIIKWHHGTGGFQREHSSYTDGVTSFCSFAESIRRDFVGVDRAKFGVLVSDITGFKGHLMNTADHEKILKAFDDIISYVDAA